VYKRQVVVFGTAPLFAAMAFVALPLFTFVFNAAVATTLLIPIVALCLGFYMNGTLSVPYYLTLAVGKPEIPARQNLLALGIVVPVVVASVLTLGLTGAAFSWIFYHLFAYAYTVPRICREVLAVSPAGWYAQLAKAGALGGISYGVTAVTVTVLTGPSVAGLAIGFTLATAIYAAGGYLVAWPELRRDWGYAGRIDDETEVPAA